MTKPLERCTIGELQKMAKGERIAGCSRLDKPSLIALLRACSGGECRAVATGPRQGGVSADFKTAPWFVFYKRGCPHCDKAKNALTRRGAEYRSLEITDRNKEEIWSITDPETDHYRYYPMIFRGGEFIGGCKEFIELLKEEHA